MEHDGVDEEDNVTLRKTTDMPVHVCFAITTITTSTHNTPTRVNIGQGGWLLFKYKATKYKCVCLICLHIIYLSS